jgi:hypothetical protein
MPGDHFYIVHNDLHNFQKFEVFEKIAPPFHSTSGSLAMSNTSGGDITGYL